MKITGGQILAVGAVGIAGFIVVRIAGGIGKAVEAVGDAAQAVNPVENRNVFSEGFNEVVGAKDRGTSLGSLIFDFFNDEPDPTARIETRRVNQSSLELALEGGVS